MKILIILSFALFTFLQASENTYKVRRGENKIPIRLHNSGEKIIEDLNINIKSELEFDVSSYIMKQIKPGEIKEIELTLKIPNDFSEKKFLLELEFNSKSFGIMKSKIILNVVSDLSFNLFQNFPNPFNNQTIIKFDIPENLITNRVSLEVYDITGRKIKTIVNDKLEPGNYKYSWDGKNDAGFDVSSGIYFYKLDIGNHSITKKMYLIK